MMATWHAAVVGALPHHDDRYLDRLAQCIDTYFPAPTWLYPNGGPHDSHVNLAVQLRCGIL